METESIDVEFTAPTVIEGEVKEHSFDGSGLNVLLFFPGAFTGPCTTELENFQERLPELRGKGATVMGVSVDTPFSLKEFGHRAGLEFPLVSDHSKQIVENYGVRTDFDEIGFYGVSERAVFIVEEGEVLWSRVMDDPEELPEVDEVLENLPDHNQD